MKKIWLVAMVIGIASMVFFGCASKDKKDDDGQKKVTSKSTVLSKVDKTKWNYNEKTDVYWQVGIPYCEKPNAIEYQTMGIFVPGVYMDAKKNADGTYTCTINKKAKSSTGYTAKDAPMIIPVLTPGYVAMAAPTEYIDTITQYTDAGFVYLYPGCRGRSEGAPAGVTDLKAALRFVRYSKDSFPGDTDKIVSYGMSGGGAQSAILGASGNSEMYIPYLQEIGAIEDMTDDIRGSMCWCPITSLEYADQGYEWNMGMSRIDLSPELQTLSNELAELFPVYINNMYLVNELGQPLTLSASSTSAEGLFQSGSYYDYLLGVVTTSLNNFLAVTSFPYTVPVQKFGNPRDIPGITSGTIAELTNVQFNSPTDGIGPVVAGGRNPDNNPGFKAVEGITLSGTYNTVEDYIKALNKNYTWVTYYPESNTATVSSVADFVKALKHATKPIGAFDSLGLTQPENIVFGYGGNPAHFDPYLGALVSNNPEYAEAFANDLTRLDSVGFPVEYRAAMYDPMNYINVFYDGYLTSEVAEFWRIRTGINQSDTALTTEVNLALALNKYGANVDFMTIWGMGHQEAELVGTPAGNFITWVHECFQ